MLGILQDHARELVELKTDVRQIRVAVDNLQEGFAEHLGWHLGRA